MIVGVITLSYTTYVGFNSVPNANAHQPLYTIRASGIYKVLYYAIMIVVCYFFETRIAYYHINDSYVALMIMKTNMSVLFSLSQTS